MRSVAVAGELTAEETLHRLLNGTTLTFRFLDGSTHMIALKGIRSHQN